METQSQNEENGGNNKGNFLCRQSTTRWTPTTDQIRILKDLYYNSGVRSPSAEQIQRISARLRQYGKIEGKNVFYWFQNHKARERQKKRFTSDHHHLPMQHPKTTTNPNSSTWMQPDQDFSSFHHTKYLNSFNNPTGFSSASPSSTNVGQIGNYGYGSVTMDRRFRDCSISTGGGPVSQNYEWVGINPSPYSFFVKEKLSYEETLDSNGDQEATEIKTLPLFPTQRLKQEDEMDAYCHINHNSVCYSHNWYGYGYGYGYGFDDGSNSSLELSLNSYTDQAP